MSDITWQHGTVEYYRVLVERTDVTGYDLSGDTVEFAFLATGADWDEALWQAGVWATTTEGQVAMALVGEDPLDLAAGRYEVFCRVTDDPERPKERVGTLTLVAQ
jgi:hypothetical protein